MKIYKKTLLFDFDGVVHSYKSGWQGIDVIPDKPVKGIKEAIESLRNDYKIIIYSSRCIKKEGIEAIKKYCKEHEIYFDDVVDKKPPAFLTIDDRCICFKGDADTLKTKIDYFVPWIGKR